MPCGSFNTNYVAVRRAARLHYGAAHKHANTQRAACTQAHRRRECTHSRARTPVLIRRSLVIIISEGRRRRGGREKKIKKADGFEAAGADRRDEAYWHLHRKGCVRSPTGFIMTGPCEGGQEPFSEPRSRYSRKLLNKISAFWGVATKDQHFFFGLKTVPAARMRSLASGKAGGTALLHPQAHEGTAALLELGC